VTTLDDAGAGSLRQALLDTPPGGVVDFQPGLSGTITLTSGELTLDKDLTIAGPGPEVLMVSGNAASRVFDVSGPYTVTLAGLTVANGQAPTDQFGGGIFNAGTLTIIDSTLSGGHALFGGGMANAGTLTITDSTLTGNVALSDGGSGIGNLIGGTLIVSRCTLTGNGANNSGGGIYNFGGTLTVAESIFSGNSAFNENPGGGIYNQDGRATVIHSTFSGNLSAYGGGLDNNGGILTVIGSTISGNIGSGIFNHVGGALTVTSSTLSGNTSEAYAGGISNSGTLTVTNSTLSGNRTTDTTFGKGGGIGNDGVLNGGDTATVVDCTLSGNFAAATGGGLDQTGPGNLTIRNTLVAGNTAKSSPDVGGSLNSQGHNLIGDGTGGSGYADTDLVGSADNPIDPLLGPLQDNGGPTLTMALLPGSPARMAGDTTDVPEWDQRGPGFLRVVDGAIDIGAYEVQEGEGTAMPHRPQAQALAAPLAVALPPNAPAGFLPLVVATPPSSTPEAASPPADGGMETGFHVATGALHPGSLHQVEDAVFQELGAAADVLSADG
jgi:hypothetical protein